MLEVRSLSVAFGGARVIDGLSLSLGRGELVSLIGPNGCGKTTLLNALTGQVRPRAGEVELFGRSILGLSPDRIARLGVARKFQVPSVFDDLSVADNLRVAQAAVARSTGGAASADTAQALSRDQVLDEIALADRAGQPAGELSHGQRQWLEVGMLLAQRPSLMLLDEPTAGMSAAETQATVRLLRRLRDAYQACMLVVEHDMRFVEALDSRVLVMMAGRVLADGRYDQIRDLPQVREAYLGGRTRH